MGSIWQNWNQDKKALNFTFVKEGSLFMARNTSSSKLKAKLALSGEINMGLFTSLTLIKVMARWFGRY